MGRGFGQRAHLGEVLWDGQVAVGGIAHAAVAARPEVLAPHPQHAPAPSLHGRRSFTQPLTQRILLPLHACHTVHILHLRKWRTASFEE